MRFSTSNAIPHAVLLLSLLFAFATFFEGANSAPSRTSKGVRDPADVPPRLCWPTHKLGLKFKLPKKSTIPKKATTPPKVTPKKKVSADRVTKKKTTSKTVPKKKAPAKTVSKRSTGAWDALTRRTPDRCVTPPMNADDKTTIEMMRASDDDLFEWAAFSVEDVMKVLAEYCPDPADLLFYSRGTYDLEAQKTKLKMKTVSGMLNDPKWAPYQKKADASKTVYEEADQGPVFDTAYWTILSRAAAKYGAKAGKATVVLEKNYNTKKLTYWNYVERPILEQLGIPITVIEV